MGDVLGPDRLLREAPLEGGAQRGLAVGGQEPMQPLHVVDPDPRPPVRELGQVLEGGAAERQQVLALQVALGPLAGDGRHVLGPSVVYAQHGLYLSATGIYGSGLINGTPFDSMPRTGLFDFNKPNHVSRSFLLNGSAGYLFVAGRTVLRPELFVDNVLDHHYLLKGAFASGAWVGRPRSVQLRLNVGI